MIRIAICDDQACQVEQIKRATEVYFSKQKESVSYNTYENAMIFLGDLERIGGFDIVLLDICMPGIMGTEVAAEIRRRKDKTEIIFLTTSSEFALDAFSLKAAHYLVKPFTQEQFDDAMNRAMLQFRQTHTSKFILKLAGGGIQVVDLASITYIESEAHIQIVHLCDGTSVKIRQTLMQLVDSFEHVAQGQFVSPCKGYLVNQKEIRSIKSDHVEMNAGQVIPLAKRKYRQFQESYFHYIFQVV